MNKKKQSGKQTPAAPTRPMRKKEEVAKSNDDHIDQDFPGYPHQPASEDIINPKNRKDRATALTDKHNGSGGAFEATEEGRDEGDDDRDGKG
jgi:hypothetical protein